MATATNWISTLGEEQQHECCKEQVGVTAAAVRGHSCATPRLGQGAPALPRRTKALQWLQKPHPHVYFLLLHPGQQSTAFL